MLNREEEEDKPIMILGTDKFLVNRDCVSYSCTFDDIIHASGGLGGGGSGVYDPVGADILANPAFEGGLGTQEDPYIISAGASDIGGKIFSNQELTLTRGKEGDVILFQDANVADNGNSFTQPMQTMPSSGALALRLQFEDVQGIASVDYVGLIKLGDIFFSWDVSVSDKGVTKPVIETIVTLDGVAEVPPYEPLFLGSSAVGAMKEVTPGSNFTAGVSETLPVVGGTGTGLQVEITVADSTEINQITIKDAGDGYLNGEQVTVDLTSINGPADHPFIVHLKPAVPTALVAKLSTFQAINAGGMTKAIWQIDEDPTFSNPTVIEISASNTNTPLEVTHGMPSNTQFYARAAVATNTITSSWSDAIRVTTGNQVTIRYMIRNLGNSDTDVPGTGWDSLDGVIAAKPNQYFLSIIGTGLDNGGTGYSAGKGSPGKAWVGIVIRGQLQIEVTAVGVDGDVLGYRVLNKSVGLVDKHNWALSGDDLKGFTLTYTSFEGGTGGSFRLNLRKDADGFTEVATSVNNGTGYTVGDILYQPLEFGNGNRGTLDKDNDFTLHGVGGRGANASSAPGGAPGGWEGNGQKGSTYISSTNGGQTYGQAGGGASRNVLYGVGGDYWQWGNITPEAFGWTGGGGGGIERQYYGLYNGGGGGASWVNRAIFPNAQQLSTSGSPDIICYVNNKEACIGANIQYGQIS